MRLRKALSVSAVVLAGWPLPLGVGYALLRRWVRFGAAVGLHLLGPMVVAWIFGRAAVAPYLAALWVAVVADTWRLVVIDWRTNLSGA